ncbi:MAG: geranylgeranyl reductase family protein [Methanomicrobiales archaeon]
MTSNNGDYDIVIVGGGPVGSTLGRYLAENKYNVAILEKKNKIGVPLQCAGLLARKVEEVNILPKDVIINRVYGAYIHSPSNNTLKVSKKEPAAYVLDRVAYDKFLSQSAVDKGCKLFLGHKVVDVDIEKGELKVKYKNKIKNFKAKIIVGAGGHSSIISRKLNQSLPTMEAVQYLVDMGQPNLNSDCVHVYVDSKISPGFIWIIPLSDSLARIGLFSKYNYHQMNHILKEFMEKNSKFESAKILKKYQGHIPLYDSEKKIVKDRAILLGDAASQVKPTSGGGLIIGFECARIASEIAMKALDQDNIKLLKEYEKNYKKKFGSELKIQLQIQKTFERMTNNELDSMFIKLKKEGAEQIISKYGDMDNQSPLLKEMIKSRIIFSVLPKVFFRRISKLWKST